jgi:hypothetical protein
MEISLEELGSIGEFVSGLAVVISLVYVGLQIREGNKVTRFDSHVRSRILLTEYQKLLVDPDIVRLWLKGLEEPQALSRDDLVRFYNLMYILVNSIELNLLAPGEGYKSSGNFSQTLGRYPGFRKWWAQAKGNYTIETVTWIDEQLQNFGTDT